MQQFRQFFIRTENDHHKKYLIEWFINSLANADELIIALINLMIFVTLEEYYNMFGSWSKLLAKFCKRDQVPLAVKISEDRTKLILSGLIWVRKQSKMITVDTLNFRTTGFGKEVDLRTQESARLTEMTFVWLISHLKS